MPKPGVLHSISPIYAAAIFLRTQDAMQVDRPVCSWCRYYVTPGSAGLDGEPGTLDHLEHRPARPRPQDMTPAAEAWRFAACEGPHAPGILVPACHGCNSARAGGRRAFQSFIDSWRTEGGPVKVADAWAWVRHIIMLPLPEYGRARTAAWAWWPVYLKARSEAGAVRARRSKTRRAGDAAILAIRDESPPTRLQVGAARSLGWVHASRLALTNAGVARLAEFPAIGF